jgi:hypothetical protein
MEYQGRPELGNAPAFVIIGLGIPDCVRCVKQRPIESIHGFIQKINDALQWPADGSG